MNIWYAIPSCCEERAKTAIERWQGKGYKVAVLIDSSVNINPNLLFRANSYPGYFSSVNYMAQYLVEHENADIVVTGGDDIDPDCAHTAEQVGEIFMSHFPDTLGVMQPTGDPLGTTDKICGSPWLGREWVLSAYRGSGPFFFGYNQFFGDEELLYVARQLGRLWQNKALTQWHHHWLRGTPKTQYQLANDRHWTRDQNLFNWRKSQNWPGHEPTQIVAGDGRLSRIMDRGAGRLKEVCSKTAGVALPMVEQLAAKTNAIGKQPLWAGYGQRAAARSPAEVRIPQIVGEWLVGLVRQLKPTLVVEVGAAFGVSGMYFLNAMEPEAKFFTFEANDQWREIAKRNYQDLMASQGYSGAKEYVACGVFSKATCLSVLGTQKCDLCFIDAIHEDKVVREQFAAILPHMSAGGVVIFDDIGSLAIRDTWRSLARSEHALSSCEMYDRIGLIEVR